MKTTVLVVWGITLCTWVCQAEAIMNKKCSAELVLTTPTSQASEKFQDDKANGDTCCEHYLLEHRRSNTASSSEAVEEVNVQRSEGPLLSKLALRVPIFLPTLEIIHRLSAGWSTKRSGQLPANRVNGRTQYGCEHARRRRFLACIDRSGRQDKGICHGAMPEVARKEQDAVRS